MAAGWEEVEDREGGEKGVLGEGQRRRGDRGSGGMGDGREGTGVGRRGNGSTCVAGRDTHRCTMHYSSWLFGYSAPVGLLHIY